MPYWLFFFLAALAVLSALGVIVQSNPVHCLMSLVVTLLAIAVLFIGEDAVVVGFLQAIVYAGAIMVLFLFVIWLLNLQMESAPQGGGLALRFVGTLAAAALAAELLGFLLPPHLKVRWPGQPLGYGSMQALSEKLFADYLIAFEVTSVLLLAAVVGAVALARRTPELAGPARASGPGGGRP